MMMVGQGLRRAARVAARAAPARSQTSWRPPDATPMSAITDPKRKEPAKSSRRRRRRGGSGGGAHGAAEEESEAAFVERAGQMKAQVAAAFAHLDVAVSEGDLSLCVDLGPDKGAFQLSLSPEKRVVEMLSPVSGAQTYKWDAQAGAWKHVSDAQDMTGMIVRDYLRAGCVGLPAL